jgi:ankyrin repeat protein
MTGECPGCGYAATDHGTFADCPRCGLIIGKYLQRHRGEDSVVQGAPIPAEATGTGFRLRRGAMAGTLVVLLACGAEALLVRSHQPRERGGEEPVATAGAEEEKALAFHRAIANGEQDKVRRLLVGGISPTVRVKNQSALETAIKFQEFEIAGLLIRNGAGVGSMDRGGESLLLQQVNMNNTATALYLLRLGVNPNTSFPEGFTVLMSAAGHGNLELMAELIARGAAVNAASTDGTTPLISATSGQHLEAMQLLLEHGAAISPRTARGYTPLKIAQEKRNPPLVELLEKAGAKE